MDKALARIVKKGSKWCVVSEDGTKNLGCSPTREGAVQRLKQVEHFKQTKGNNMNYDQAFTNMAKALSSEINPSEVGSAPDAQPRLVNINDSRVSQNLQSGTIAGNVSDKLLDKKEHFPVITETQARSSLTRVMQLKAAPIWYRGTLTELQNEVYQGAVAVHPTFTTANINVSLDRVMGLSDGQTPSETTKTGIKNPADIQKTEVPEVARPTITTAELQDIYNDDAKRTALAGQLMECIQQQEDALGEAKKLAGKLMKKGLSGDDFACLSTYMQENILREMLFNDQNSADAKLELRRQELLGRLSS